MTNASARVCAASSAALLLCFASPGAWASDRVRTTAAITIQASVAVTIVNTVINSAPMQTLLLTAAIAPVGMVFGAPSSNAGAGLVSVGAPGGGGTGGGGLRAQSSGGASPADSSGGGAADFGGALPGADGGGAPALIVIGGSLTGTTIDGDAISVNIGDLSGGSAADSVKVPVVIAQYN